MLEFAFYSKICQVFSIWSNLGGFSTNGLYGFLARKTSWNVDHFFRVYNH